MAEPMKFGSLELATAYKRGVMVSSPQWIQVMAEVFREINRDRFFAALNMPGAQE